MFEKLWMILAGRPTLISPDDVWALLFVMCASIFAAIFLEQKFRLASKITGAIIALLIALVLSNAGIIPSSCALYDDVVWGIIVPIAMPMLLLRCNLKKIWSQTGHLLVIFLIGALGTTIGAFIAYFLLKNSFENVKDLAKVAAMMTASYIGGGVNFVAMASQYAPGSDITAATSVADNLLMAAYFFALVLFASSKFLRSKLSHPYIDAVESSATPESKITQAASFWSRKEISLKDIAINVAFSVTVVFISRFTASLFSNFEITNLFMNFIVRFLGSQYVWITTFSVLAATFASSQVEQLNGSQEVGSYLIYMFLFVIGVPANIFTVFAKSPALLLVTSIMVFTNMIFCLAGAKLFKFNLEDSLIASNACIGGPTTAAGMAISQGWAELAGPAMLVGTLGYVLGNYMGTITAIALGL